MTRHSLFLLGVRPQVGDLGRPGRVDLGHLEDGAALEAVGVVLHVDDAVDVDIFLDSMLQNFLSLPPTTNPNKLDRLSPANLSRLV
jgi:hypothetical protein